MVRIIDYQATGPIRKVNQNRRVMIPQTPRRIVLASLRLTIPQRNSNKNFVELISTIGVHGVSGTSQILFKIFRDGREIFRTQEGVEADPESEVNYTVTFQALERNVNVGSHLYQVTAENITNGTEAAVVGPISFSGLAVDPADDRNQGRDRDRDRDQDRDRDRFTRFRNTRQRNQNRRRTF